MSRIEKALKKAIEQQDLPHVSSRTASDASLIAPDLGPIAAAMTGIERMSQATSALSPEQRMALRIISPEFSQDAAVKAFRELRTKIGQRVAPGAVIMVTSVEEGGGSSFVAVNLATAIAFDSTRTALLIDCNLRSASLNRLLPNGSTAGFTDYLHDEKAEIADIIHPTGIERLRLVPVGQKGGEQTEYFTLDKMRRLISGLATRYPDRQVILDAPPIASSADAQILASFCDHILVVVPYGKVTESRLQAAFRSIEASKLLGVVLNDEPAPPSIRWREIFAHLYSAIRERLFRTRPQAVGKESK